MPYTEGSKPYTERNIPYMESSIPCIESSIPITESSIPNTGPTYLHDNWHISYKVTFVEGLITLNER